jgi:hypothetical protein
MFLLSLQNVFFCVDGDRTLRDLLTLIVCGSSLPHGCGPITGATGQLEVIFHPPSVAGRQALDFFHFVKS